jgi:DNA-binding CsgD family transcriptional regulator
LRPIFGEDLISSADYAHSEVWNDYASKEVGALYVIGASIPLGGSKVALLGVHRGRKSGGFSQVDGATLGRLLPHLQRALQLQERFKGADAYRAGAGAVLQCLRTPSVLVDGAGKVIFMNAAAEALVRRTDGVRVVGGRTAAAGREGDAALLRLVVDAARRGAGGVAGLQRPSGRTPFVAIVAPMPAALSPPFFGGCAGPPRTALVLFIDRDVVPSPPTELLRQAFGFTAAEAAVAKALSEGMTVAEIAQARGVSVANVRSQVRGVLDKSDARRLVDVTRCMTGLAAAPCGSG